MSLYQKEYSFKGIVFSSSPSIISFCEIMNITVIQRISRNEFGLPFVKDMLIELASRYRSEYYGYMNSDILLNPNVFNALERISKKMNTGIYPYPIGITSTVMDVKYNFSSNDFDTINNTRLLFKRNFTKSRMRGSSAKVSIVFI